MKELYKIILAGTLVAANAGAFAQQEGMYTNYMFNTLTVNPAYAGSREALTANLLHRSQWVSFDGAPTSQTFTIHDLLKNRKIGWGLSVVNDKSGPVKNMGVNADFAYILKLSQTSKLAFGLKGGINYMEVRLNSLQLDEESDPAFQNNIMSKMLPNFGFGMYYSRPRFYTGISSPKLMENNFKARETGFTTSSPDQVRHYYFIAGGLIKLSDNLELKPTTFIKATTAAPLQADLTTSFIYNKRFRIGAMFRTGDAVGLLAGYYITDNFHVGYSYDWSYGLKTMKYNYGSHEILLSYELPKKERNSVVRFL
ncbi:MAG TPA: type IX secretion system membrane protein PorP/SprF [Bacteroidia bacterium]|jgi:type IX secretion system PorP/SprF family membrane protein